MSVIRVNQFYCALSSEFLQIRTLINFRIRDWRIVVKENIDAVRENRWCEVGIFQDLAADEIKELESKCHYREVAAGTVFYESQEAGETMFLIKKGRVRLYHLSAEGKTFTTAILEAGDFFGDMLFERSCYECFAEATTACAICSMSRADVETFLLGDRRIAVRIVENLGRRLHGAEQRLADSVLKNIPSRLAALLLRIARRNDSADVFLTHEELAQLLGMRRETITRFLNELQNQNLIALHRGRIALLDTETLKKIGAK